MNKFRGAVSKAGLAVPLVFLVCAAVLSLAACHNTVVTDLRIEEDSVPAVAQVGQFNISAVRLLATREGSDVPDEIAASISMLNSADKKALETPGEHSITIHYKRKTAVFNVLIVDEGTETVEVKFYDAAGEKLLATRYAVKDGSVLPPVPPEAGDNIFDHWKDSATGEPLDPGKVSASTAVRAFYRKNTENFTITFKGFNEETIKIAYPYGTKGGDIVLPEPAKPSDVESYSWNIDAATYVVDRNDTISMTVVYKKYTVMYTYAYESAPDRIKQLPDKFDKKIEKVKAGGRAKNADAVKNYLNSEVSEFVEWENLPSKITKDAIVKAIVKDEVAVSFPDETKFEQIATGQGVEFSLPKVVEKPGFSFDDEWRNCDTGEIAKYPGAKCRAYGNMKLEPVYRPIKTITLDISYHDGGNGTETETKEIPAADDSLLNGRVTDDGIAAFKNGYKNAEDTNIYENRIITKVIVDGVAYSGKFAHDIDIDAGSVVVEIWLIDPSKETEGLNFAPVANGVTSVAGYTGNDAFINVLRYHHDGSEVSEVTAIGPSAFNGKTIEYVNFADNSEGTPAGEWIITLAGGAFDGAVFGGNMIFDKIASIESGAFKNAKVLQPEDAPAETPRTVKIDFTGSTFASIPGDAFDGSENISEVVLPKTCAAIGNGTENVSGNDLTKIDLGNVAQIGDYAFKNCKKLTAIDLGGAISVGARAFAGCAGLTKVTGEKTERLGEGAFSDCTALASVSLPALTNLNDGSNFKNCEKLQNIAFVYGIAEIPECAFEGCDALKEADFTAFPASGLKVGKRAFSGCEGMEYVVVGIAVNEFGENAFGGCANLKAVKFIGTGGLLTKKGEDNGPCLLDGTIFPDGAFIYIPANADDSNLRNYVGRVKKIYPSISFRTFDDKAARADLNGALYLSEPPAHDEKGEYIFDGWYFKDADGAYSRVEYPQTVTEDIVLYAKYIDKSRGSFDGRDLTKLDDGTFRITNCGDAVDKVYIPTDSDGRANFAGTRITELDSSAFSLCADLKEIVIPEGIIAILKSAAGGFNAAAKRVVIPASVTKIADGVFASCENLKDIEFADGSNLVDASAAAFEGTPWFASECEKHKMVVAGRLAIKFNGTDAEAEIPPGVIKLADGLFENVAVETVVFNPELEIIGGGCFRGSKLKTIEYRDRAKEESKLSEIAKGAFEDTPWFTDTESDLLEAGTIILKYRNLSGESEYRLPDYVTEISYGAFERVGIEKIVFGKESSLRRIKDGAFKESSITEIALNSEIEEIGKDAFKGCLSLGTADFSQVTQVAVLPEGCFSGCKNLKTLKLNVGFGAFGPSSLLSCKELNEIAAPGFIETDGLAVSATNDYCGINDTAWYNKERGAEDVFLVLGKVLVKFLPKIDPSPSVRTINIPEGVKKISGFDVDNSLIPGYKVNIPAAVTDIGNSAFAFSATVNGDSSAQGAAEIKVADGSLLVNIGDYAFANCTNLEKFDFPEGLKIIGKGAFSGAGLAEIILPDSLTHMGDGAFAHMANLQKAVLGAGIIFLGEKAFDGSTQLYKVDWTAYYGESENVVTAKKTAFDELNKNIKALYRDDEAAAKTHVEGIFPSKTGSDPALRIYVREALYGFIDASDDAVVKAWRSGSRLFKEGDYPSVSSAGSDFEPIEVLAVDQYLTEIPSPVKEGCTFTGWFADAALKEPLVLPRPIYENMSIYPGWFKNTVDLNDDNPDTVFEFSNGKIIGIKEGSTLPEVLYVPSAYKPQNAATAINITGIGFSPSGDGAYPTYENVKKIVLTAAADFNEIDENCFRYFPNLEDMELISPRGDSNLKVLPAEFTDNYGKVSESVKGKVLYRDGDTLIAFLKPSTAAGAETPEYIAFAVPDGTESILPYAFANSTLSKITLPAAMSAIGSAAFNDGLKDLAFAEGIMLTDADKHSFENTQWYKGGKCVSENRTEDNALVGRFYSAGNLLFGYKTRTGGVELKIPTTLNSFDITVIASEIIIRDGQTDENVTFDNMILPDKLVKINSKAFAHFDVAERVDFANEDAAANSALTDIADDVFDKMTFYGGRNMITLGKVLLKCRSTVSSIVVEEGIVAIAANAFKGGQAKTVALPESLVRIGDGAFLDCSKLSAIEIPSGVREIGNRAFANCIKLSEVNFGKNVFNLRRIGDEAFHNCKALAAIDLPYTAEILGEGAFENCLELTSVIFDDIKTETDENNNTVRTVLHVSELNAIGKSAFKNCPKLRSIAVPDKVGIINESTFEGCSALERAVFDSAKSKVTEIGKWAFKDCVKLGGVVEVPADIAKVELPSVVLPNSLLYIRDNAFEGCKNLYCVTINYNVKEIGKEVFLGCVRLTKINIHAGNPAKIVKEENESTGTFTRSAAGREAVCKLRIYVDDNDEIFEAYNVGWGDLPEGVSLFRRGELPTLKYCLPASGPGQEDEYSAPVSADIAIDPKCKFGTVEYVQWEIAGEGGAAPSALDKDKRFFEQANPESPGTPYRILIIDEDMVLRVKSAA